MDELRPEETVDIGGGDFAVLRYRRLWPRYILEWTARRRQREEGESFPLGSGTLESLTEPDWDSLRAQALDLARSAAGKSLSSSEGASRRGLRRLFSRG
ncbi:MAG TPA: hypothetical protein VFB34_13255 [Chloroflexota bacterium]|nr:hypothetical protein [Chloroflexota bacterium]